MKHNHLVTDRLRFFANSDTGRLGVSGKNLRLAGHTPAIKWFSYIDMPVRPELFRSRQVEQREPVPMA